MTVKIINTIPDPTVVKHKVCPRCGLTLEFVPVDIKERTLTDYTGDVDTIRYIDCPNCSHQITIR